MTERKMCPFISGPKFGIGESTELLEFPCQGNFCMAWEWDDEHIKEGHCKLISGGK